MIIEGTFLLKACLYIAIGFFSLHYIDQRKVTDMQNLFKFFWVCLVLYLLLIMTEIILTFNYIGNLFEKEIMNKEDTRNQLTTYFVGIRFIAVFAYVGFVVAYYKVMSKYN